MLPWPRRALKRAVAAAAPPANTPATGLPTISGTAQVGETLTADTSGIEDDDGIDNAAFAYQWLADDAEINGATAATYTLTDADEGKTIKVRVSFTDDRGHDDAYITEALYHLRQNGWIMSLRRGLYALAPTVPGAEQRGRPPSQQGKTGWKAATGKPHQHPSTKGHPEGRTDEATP